MLRNFTRPFDQSANLIRTDCGPVPAYKLARDMLTKGVWKGSGCKSSTISTGG
jgi:hypothetical protein